LLPNNFLHKGINKNVFGPPIGYFKDSQKWSLKTLLLQSIWYFENDPLMKTHLHIVYFDESQTRQLLLGVYEFSHLQDMHVIPRIIK
jgi:hypothetical protein